MFCSQGENEVTSVRNCYVICITVLIWYEQCLETGDSILRFYNGQSVEGSCVGVLHRACILGEHPSMQLGAIAQSVRAADS